MSEAGPVRRFLGWLHECFRSSKSSGHVVLWLLRGFFGAILIGLAWISFDAFNHPPTGVEPDPGSGILAFVVILGIGFLVVATDLLVRDKQITTISAVYFGLLLGLLLGNLLTVAIEPFIPGEWTEMRQKIQRVDVIRTGSGPNAEVQKDVYLFPTTEKSEKTSHLQMMKLMLTVICCYISISVLLQTKDEFRFIIPYVEFSKQVKGNRPLVLDTSVIIDGRIADICDTRFIDTKLIVPRFVLQELQSVADSSDKLKRNRGRRGLDMLKRMQSNSKIDLQMHEANIPELREVAKVDERLVVLAKVLGARVVTNDYNLNKIAQLQGVEVINLNELSNALKSVALPGEVMNVRLVKHGDQPGQGVGYLEDGTMVVVEQGKPHIGQEVPVTVTSVLQTPAGRMLFGRVDSRPPGASGGQAG